jgi:peptide/nickel transport system substrate-binding protein
MVTIKARYMRALALGVAAVLMAAACTQTGQPTPTPTGSGATPTGTPTGSGAPSAEPSGTAGGPQSGGTLFMLMSTATSNGGVGFQDMDPQRTYTGEDIAFFSATINRTLTAFTYDPDAAVASGLVPDAATDIGTSSDEAKTWSFTLRDGIKWQDGSDVTCEDFKYGASRVFAVDLVGGGPAYALAYLDIPTNDDGTSQYPGPYTATEEQQALFDQAVVCDGNTITYHLNNPIADFNYTVTLGLGAVPSPASHPDFVDQFGETGSDAYDQQPFSDGPYMIESRLQGIGGHLHLVRNPNYDPSTDESGRQAYPDEWSVSYGIPPDVFDQRLMNPSGDDSHAVSYGGVLPVNLDTIFADPHTANPAFEGRAFSDYDPYSSYYTIRTDLVPNVKIRQAMAVALDRAALRQNGGGDFVGDYADGFIKPNIGQDYAETHLWEASGPFGRDIPDTGDTEFAQQLIAESGEAAPTLTWQYISTPVSDKGAGIIQDSLQKAGFTVNLSIIPGNRYACYFDAACQTEFQSTGWGPDWPNASTVIGPLFTQDGGWDISRVGMKGDGPDPGGPDQDYVDAVHANYALTDRQAQAAEWQRLNALATERMFAIPTFFGLAQNIAGDKVGNLYRWGPYGSWPYAILYVKQ